MGTNGGDLFKTTLMGGYDKDDVAEGITRMKDEAFAEKTRLLNSIKEKEKKITELNGKLAQKDKQVESLQRDIKEKYQSYIDNYESIARLVYDAQIRAEDIIREANEKSTRIMEQAKEAAQKCLESVQHDVDERLSEGKKKYIAVQEELNDTVELMNQVQRRFMESCRAVHNIVSTMPESMQELEDDMDEEIDDSQEAVKEAAVTLEEHTDEEDDDMRDLEDRLESQIHAYLNSEE